MDILNEETLVKRINEFPLVVIAEQEGLPGNVVEALRTYVNGGGRLLLSGPRVATELADLAGVEAVEGQVHGQGLVPADNGCVPASGTWQAVKCAGAIELAPLLNQQEPKLNLAGTPAATLNRVGNGTVVAVHGPIFRAYYVAHYPRLRRFVGDMVNALGTSNLVHVDGPWWIEMSARRKNGHLMIQFANRAAAGFTSPNRHMVESVPDTGPFTVTVPMSQRPTRCYMAPDDTGLEWTWKDNVLTAKIASLAIHNVLVIE